MTETALDQLEGTLLDVGPESVRFEFDGDKIDVRREKLEGLVYYQPVRRELPPPTCRLIDAGGSQWSLQDGRAGRRAAGADNVGRRERSSCRCPAWPGSIFRSATSLTGRPGARLGRRRAARQPAAGRDDGQVRPRVQGQPRPPLGADGFRIGGKSYDSGLSLHSPATLVYRVPEGFRQLHAVAGVDDSIVAPGQFELRILGDGKELFRHEFSGAEAAGRCRSTWTWPACGGCRSCSIRPTGQDIGDQLNLCEARFTK